MNDLRVGWRLGAAILSLSIALVACSGAAASPSPIVTDPPPASGIDDGNGGNVGDGELVFPKPGQLDVHTVAADEFSATVDGSTIRVEATWTSGVEPCSTLDSVVVERSEGAFSIAIREGHGGGDVACIMIAVQKRTVFEIPDVAPGTYTIRDAGGNAPDIEVVVG